MQYFLVWLTANLFNHYSEGYKAGYARAMSDAEGVLKATIANMATA